jgi:hypothetical protein
VVLRKLSDFVHPQQVHICTGGLIVTPPPSSPVTTATVFTFPPETSYTSIPMVGGVLSSTETTLTGPLILALKYF